MRIELDLPEAKLRRVQVYAAIMRTPAGLVIRAACTRYLDQQFGSAEFERELAARRARAAGREP